MSQMKHNAPHFELARIYQDGSQEIEQIELYDLENVLKKGTNLKMARRGFIGLSVLSTSALLAACGVSAAATPKPSPTPTPTDTPTPTPPPTGQASSGSGELDVRVGPGYDYDLSFMLPDGTQFTISARDSTSTWVEISMSDGRKGWVLVSQITIESPVGIDSLPVSSDIQPTPVPTVVPTYGGGGGSYCTCNEICTCIPVGG